MRSCLHSRQDSEGRLGIKIGDQVFRLVLLIWKSTIILKEHLFVAYIDLKVAFDLVPRHLLWNCIIKLGATAKLVSILVRLHTKNYARVRWGKDGSLRSEFPFQGVFDRDPSLPPHCFQCI